MVDYVSRDKKRRIEERFAEASQEIEESKLSRTDEMFSWIDSTNEGVGEYKTDPSPGFANLSIRGTSTTNYKRPRTVAAGYDPETRTMTVVFRDNTWWNYYDVPEDMWREFEMSESKGRYLRESGLDAWHNMGPFSPDSLRPDQASLLNYVARQSEENQQRNKGTQTYREDIGSQFYEI